MTTLQCDNDKRPSVPCAQHPKRPLLESSIAVETMMAMRLSWSCRIPRMRHQYPNPSTKPGVESCIKWHLLVKVQVWLVYSLIVVSNTLVIHDQFDWQMTILSTWLSEFLHQNVHVAWMPDTGSCYVSSIFINSPSIQTFEPWSLPMSQSVLEQVAVVMATTLKCHLHSRHPEPQPPTIQRYGRHGQKKMFKGWNSWVGWAHTRHATCHVKSSARRLLDAKKARKLDGTKRNFAGWPGRKEPRGAIKGIWAYWILYQGLSRCVQS